VAGSAGHGSATFTTASTAARAGAMVYEALLLLAVAFGVSYVLLASLGWTYPLAESRRAVLQLALFTALGVYFVVCWSRGGQTLAMKTWRLKVVQENGRPPGKARALLRYVLAWLMWLPGIVASATLNLGVGGTLLALAGGFTVMLAPALFDSSRRLLHDRWSGTRLVRAA